MTFSRRSFQYTAPTFWNELPIKLRHRHLINSFKSILKTYTVSFLSSLFTFYVKHHRTTQLHAVLYKLTLLLLLLLLLLLHNYTHL